MSTTTIRLPDELKVRVAEAAKQAGTTSHNFILEAIAARADSAERQADFYAEATRRYERVAETGETIPWNEFRDYLTDRIHGKATPRPVARKLAK